MQWKEMVVESDAAADIEFEGADIAGKTATIKKGRISVKDLAIQRHGEAWPGWWGQIDIDEGKVARGLVDVAIRLEGKDARPAVRLLDAEDAIPSWATGLLAMEGLKASARIKWKGADVDFRLLRADAGSLALRGRLKKSGGHKAIGAFFARNGPLSVGIDIEEHGTSVHPFAGDSWMDERMAALDR
jgi:hypothetical protein